MGDVTVRIQGVGSSGSGGGSAVPPSGTPPVPPTPPGASGTTAPSGSSISAADNRMVEDLRRAILAYGAVYVPTNSAFKPILQTVEQQQRKVVDDDISQRYAERRTGLEEQREGIIVSKLNEYNALREKELQGVTDKKKIERINEKWDEISDTEIDRLVKPIDAQLSQIDEEESEERKEKQDELTQALQELTDAINKSGTLNPDSYLGQLRQQRQEAIFERDTAEDEESARAAAQRVRDIDQQIKDVTDGRVEPDEKINRADGVMQTLLGTNLLLQGMSRGDIGSVAMGMGKSVTGILGSITRQVEDEKGKKVSKPLISKETSEKTLAWIGALSGVTSIFSEEGQRSDQMAGLAALVRNDPQFEGFGSISRTREKMYDKLYWTPGIHEMGFSVPDFAESATNRISQRGMVQDGISEAFYQEALERVFSLDSGSLGAAGKYDRYGVYATDAIADLVSRLERISGSGVTQGNYARVREYLDMQQDLMGNYMRFADKPTAAFANRDLAAFASLSNYTVDTRTSEEIKAIQNQLINPQNDRMKAILYSVVEETFSEYKGQNVRGRVDLIDQILNDPTYQGAVEKALMTRLTSMYGGFDTPMGYMMIKSQLQGIESPERRRAIWEGITSGKAGQILSTASIETGQKLDYSKEIMGYVSDTSRAMIEMSDALFNTVSKVEESTGAVKTIVNILEIALGRKSIREAIMGE